MKAKDGLLSSVKHVGSRMVAAGRAAAVVTVTGLLLGSCSGDPRDYDSSGGDVTVGDGSLETVLVHYSIALPCHATGVHFHDEESFAGSEGTLYLRFDTSRACLGSFARTAGLSLKSGSVHTWRDDHDFSYIEFAGDEAQSYGWRFPISHTYRWGSYTASDPVTVQVVVDQRPSGDRVYLVGQHG
ncbi:hypothetical protein ACH4S8_01470 [Streptomyces sp. NPDC021080]|uniref:hypothetical protein n=1 Tax=Streptomyces sp. NPDC021080 TaxID=3365110 RepID=UPI003788F565